jgi:uncharacterized protein (TIGR03437 family)
MRKALGVAGLLVTAWAGLGAQPSYWIPAPNTPWQWQLTGTVDQTVNVAMYDIDLFNNSASVVASLHAQGRKVVCYMSAGSWEDFRSDAASFLDSVKGSPLDGFPNERWLDIRNLTVLGPIMEARLDMCKAKGFDGVEPDNVDGYSNQSGFPLTDADQIRYNTWIANAAHARGLSVGFKNDLDQAAQLQPLFDWALNEQCFQYKECDALMPFVQAGKAVFQVEYKLAVSQFCLQANSLNFNSMRKNVNLDAFRDPCRTGVANSILMSPNGLVNGASVRADSVAPGEIITIFGSGLGPALAATLTLNSLGLVDTTLGQVRAYFDGIPAPLIYVQSSQLNVSVPYAVAGKSSTQVQVEYQGQRSDPVTLQVSDASPGIFTFDPGGKGQGAILNEDGRPNSASNPAASGSIVVLYATGEGQTNPPGVDGKLAVDVLPKPLGRVSVRIGGLDAEVLYAGGAPFELAGVMQVNVRLPNGVSPGNSVPVQLTVGNATSQPGVTLAIK